ncbi:MAG: hypothetical protein PHF18_01545 [Methanosarcina sp.]|uniref:hypothetical protein n=1 Tax=Methanosarcina sp. TaxID=2213 RepID=UPI002639922B|nr:hypothetical protein [Methanosarcina sp.]MDD3245552.1 hypothetical protein [Methanosarcina sp.]
MSISSKISRKRGLKKDMELRTSIIKLLIIYKGVGKKAGMWRKNTAYSMIYATTESMLQQNPCHNRIHATTESILQQNPY